MDRARSPLLRGQTVASAEEVAVAIAILARGPVSVEELMKAVSPAKLAETELQVRCMIAAALEPSLDMVPPRECEMRQDPGFGRWAILMGDVMRELNMGLAEALKTEIAPALVAVNVRRWLNGWTLATGARSYKDRDGDLAAAETIHAEEEHAR